MQSKSMHSNQAPRSVKFTALESKITNNMALLYAVRMLGLFLLTPVFSEAALTLSGGDNLTLVGIALGAYGITQAIMQIPLGMASDRWGRKPIVVAGLVVFVIGGVVCAMSSSVIGVMIGRFIQGFGAVSAAISAWIADGTRPEVRTKAMAMTGGTIAIAFAVALVLSPFMLSLTGLSGLFWTITAMGVICVIIAGFIVPTVPMHGSFETEPDGIASAGEIISAELESLKPYDPQSSASKAPKLRISSVLKNANLLRLNFSVFALNVSMMALFVVAPILLSRSAHLDVDSLWKFYLPTIVIAFVFMMPLVPLIERFKKHRMALLLAVVLIGLAALASPSTSQHLYPFAIAFIVYFFAFNLLEALLPSLVSQFADPQSKGLALGVFNTCQALGVALGGAIGGVVAHSWGNNAVFAAIALLALVWIGIGYGLKPSAVRH